MPTNTGVIVKQTTSTTIPLKAQLEIAVVGTCTTGTLAASTPTRIRTADEATAILGSGGATDTLPQAVALLQRYGCGNLVVIKGATADEAGVLAAIPLLANSITQLGVAPQVVVCPSFNSVDIVAGLKALVDNIRAIALVNFTAATSVTDALTARDADDGVGIKDNRIVACFPHLKNTDDPTKLEEVSLHLAGILANLGNYGQSPLNQSLRGVNGTDVAMSLSYSSETSDNEKLNDVGVLTVNRDFDGEYVVWGGRNSSYSEGLTDVLTFINAVRARDEITRLVEMRLATLAFGSHKFLSQESNLATASLLRESFINCLAEEASKGAIKSGYQVVFNESLSNFDAGILDYAIEFAPWLPIELIRATVKISIKVGG
ncbi:MAG: hypothetical protein F6K41_04765 [Symploca sp. SIO3E6]|nr:hypothetical protein [Caldora sp. SIO3E6]